MKFLPRAVVYGLIAIALVASSFLFRSSTPIAEARCNNNPARICTHDNGNKFNSINDNFDDNVDPFGVLSTNDNNDNNFNNNANRNGNSANECEINLNNCSE